MRAALITGASTGIGLATAKAFLNAGVAVVGVARDREKLAAMEADCAALPAPLATLALVLVLAEIGLGGLLVLWQVPLATALLHQALGVLAFGALSLLMWRANAPVSNGQALHVGSLSRA